MYSNTDLNSLSNQNNEINKPINILYSKDIEKNELSYYISEYNDINKPIFKKLKRKYPELQEKLENIATSSNKHTIKIITTLQLLLVQEYEEYKLCLQYNTKVMDIERTKECTYEHKLIDDNNDKILIFAFRDAQEIKDLFLNTNYYHFKNVFTYKYIPKIEDYKNNNIYNIQNYIGADATKIIKKRDYIRYEILKILKDFIKNRISYKSSALILTKQDNKIIFPEVEKHPTLHEYNTIPTPEQLYKELINIDLSREEKETILKELSKLDRDHNILVMAYAIGTFLMDIIPYQTTPYLILYGHSNCGKTITANLFNFFTIQSDRTTTTQIMRTAQGYGCGYFVLDEPKTLNNDVIQLLKDLATKKKYIKTYGKTGQKYIFKVGGIISANSIYEIKTKNTDDLNAFFRRNIVIKINENDSIRNIDQTINYLQDNKNELIKLFIDYLTEQDPQELINKYESTNTDEKQYKFIIFSLEMLKELFNKYGIEFLTDTRINEIIKRLKETEKEFQQDILKDDNIITMIEQIIYNDLLKIATLKDREPEKLNELDTLNKYSEILYKQHGYTIYYMKDKKRIAINKTGQQKLIKILNREYGTNYPEQTTQKYLMDKLTEKGINAKIKQARISNNKNAIQPRCLFIEIPYNYDLLEYKDIINIMIVIADMNRGIIEINEIKEYAEKKGIKEIQINDCINALKHYEIIKEIEKDIYEVNIKELEKATEPEPQENEPEQQNTPTEPKNNSEKVLNVLTALKNIFGNDLIDFDSIKDQLPELSEQELQNELDKLYYTGDIDQPRPNKYRVL